MKSTNILLIVISLMLFWSCKEEVGCSKDAIGTLEKRFNMYIPPRFPYFQKNCRISNIVVEYDSPECCTISFSAKGQNFAYYYYVINAKHYDKMEKTDGGTLIKEAKGLYNGMKKAGFTPKGDEDEFLHSYIYRLVSGCEDPF